MPTSPISYVVRDHRQVRALSGPLQHQIISTLERAGPSSAKQLAEQMRVTPEVLYYHLRKLERVGLLLTTEIRATGYRPERVFELPASELLLDPDDRRPVFLEAIARLQRSIMAMATRLYARAVRDEESVRAGSRRNLGVIQLYGRLRPNDLAELNRRLEGIADFVAARDDPKLDHFLSVTISMSPVTRD